MSLQQGDPDNGHVVHFVLCHHSKPNRNCVGTQNIRTMSMIQLLLGNMGMAGGGVNALRGSPMSRDRPTMDSFSISCLDITHTPG